ncbi:xylose isomerase [Culicoidibacter larvae]|uniref:Xylose isomerase n=1 Tax=Culicoidibacter larvae TaxID=2579976 RepID=A0A5R8QAW6_9FIRM|nr:xylose isomerase [Culicoidibacter larvae]TLG72765.1 xylose isomerase [Culicoidibacter larvae]
MYFKQDKIQYLGASSKEPFAFKYYNADELVAGKPMSEHLKFAMSYWHTLTAMGVDPFGMETMFRPWDDTTDAMEQAKARVYAGFEFMEKLGLRYFCFHDKDIAPLGKTITETNANLDVIVDIIEAEMKRTGIKLLWGTTNAFAHPRFMHGAATSPNADVFAYAAAQVKKAMEITKRLGGEGYVFWGGREGYETLLNTDMKREQNHLAAFLQMAANYADEIGFDGGLFIEPKPKEPTKHQYDFDAATVVGFLKTYNLDGRFKLNLETNHATLAGHTFHHEIQVAIQHGLLGSIDINYGDVLLGWDTDQFPTNIYDAVLTMYELLKLGGLPQGGLNFDAKVRRGSFTEEDLLLAYIAGMDTYAKGLKVAARLLEDGVLEQFIQERYASYDQGIGAKIEAGTTNLNELADYVVAHEGELSNQSGRQEWLEATLNQYIFETK